MDGWMDGWMENIRQHHRKSELYLNSIQQIRDYNKFVFVRFQNREDLVLCIHAFF